MKKQFSFFTTIKVAAFLGLLFMTLVTGVYFLFQQYGENPNKASTGTGIVARASLPNPTWLPPITSVPIENAVGRSDSYSIQLGAVIIGAIFLVSFGAVVYITHKKLLSSKYNMNRRRSDSLVTEQ